MTPAEEYIIEEIKRLREENTQLKMQVEKLKEDKTVNFIFANRPNEKSNSSYFVCFKENGAEIISIDKIIEKVKKELEKNE